MFALTYSLLISGILLILFLYSKLTMRKKFADVSLGAAIEAILNSTETDEQLKLDSHQIEILLLSEKDIENGNLITESHLRKADSEWMD